MITGFDENETDMFQVEELVLELKKTGSCQVRHVDEEKEKHEDIVLGEVKLTVRISQGSEGQLMRVVKEEEGRYVGIDEQHSDVFERNQVNQVQRELEDNLFLESKYTDIEQRLFGKSQEGKYERAKVRIQQLQREDNKQQFEDEWTEYNNKWKTNYQSEDKLDIEIERIIRLMMKVPQKKAEVRRPSNSKRNTTTDCETITSGAKQHKVWKPREQQQTTAATKDKLQNNVWDIGRQRSKAHDQEIMIILTLGV